jgi:site-specific DNA recombinase
MRAAVYLRISDDRQGLELGVDRQRDDCTGLARQRGWPAVEFIDNDISATKGKRRPGYIALMAAADRGELDRIVVWHTSRLWRNRRERAEGIERLQHARVSVVPVKGPELDMTTAYGRGMAGLVGEFDTMESEVKSERQQAEARQRAQRGEPGGGRRAFGYDRTGRLFVEREVQAVEEAYRALLAGRTLTGIAADLNAAGFTTTMGGPWKHNSVRLMLCNARNAGIRTHRGVEIGPAVWPGIVSEEMYRAAVDVLAAPRGAPTVSATPASGSVPGCTGAAGRAAMR